MENPKACKKYQKKSEQDELRPSKIFLFYFETTRNHPLCFKAQAKKNNTLASGNAGDEKNLHPGARKNYSQ